MTKIVINRCFGGFGLSHEAMMRYGELKNLNLVFKKEKYVTLYYINSKIDDSESYFDYWKIDRDDPALVQVIEELGDKANGEYAKLEIVEIPEDVTDWYIHNYDGRESINESHRSW